MKEADDGDHFRLAFDKPGTWSQKYNVVWDRILGLNLFPAAALRKEMDFYKTKQNAFGLPLDSRKDYTKLDWTLWTATLTQDRADFDGIAGPGLSLPQRNAQPRADDGLVWTQDAKKVGFQARSVVGGVFLQMLYDAPVWKKWAGGAETGSWQLTAGSGHVGLRPGGRQLVRNDLLIAASYTPSDCDRREASSRGAPLLWRGYSCRSATIGLMAAARRAGRLPAPRATRLRTPSAARKTQGSRAPRPNNCDATSRLAANAGGETNHQADGQQNAHLTHDQPHDFARPGAPSAMRTPISCVRRRTM